MDNSLSDELNKIYRSNLEKKISRRFDIEEKKIRAKAREVNDRLEKEQENREEEKLDKEFDEFIAKRLEDEYKDENKINTKNFNYLYEKNRQGILLYPPVSVSVEGWSSEGLILRRQVDRRIKSLLEPYGSEGGVDMQRKVVYESLLKEGEIQRSLIPGPFQTPAIYLAVSAAFIFKFWRSLE